MKSGRKPFSYDSIAAEYASKVDSAPYNALYERPAMLSMLPGVEGQIILDAGCGSGWYAEQLAGRGAHVDAIDASASMAEFARERLERAAGAGRFTVQVADLSERLPFEDARFAGALSALVLHYLIDWRPALREIHRVLQPGGWLLLSTHHPSADATHFSTNDYFRTEHVTDHWDWVGDVQFYRRSLTEIFASLRDSSFAIDTVSEPAPTREFMESEPVSGERLMRQPEFLIVLAKKAGSGAENA
ncbi:MAG: class I SAM-dependent methyltransferase [Gemmatimonadaceae bacterium]